MPVLVRYLLIQLPEWLLLACLLWWPLDQGWIGRPVAGLVLGLWILKDLLLYPVARSAFQRGSPPTGAHAQIGERGRVATTLAPRGLVKIRGELWTARAADGQAIHAGARVRVIAARGLTLICETEQDVASRPRT